jgi:anaerobic C4-dicarboxylate transporter
VKRKVALAIILVWIALGVAALTAIADSTSVVGEYALILPAVPFSLAATTIANERRGFFWDSAHGPPFLTLPGVLLVYFLPAFLGLVWLWRTGRGSRQ